MSIKHQERQISNMDELAQLKNIGKVVAEQLHAVGIHNFSQLKEAGSKNAWLKIKNIDSSACINRLYALEGAILDIRWHDLTREKKEELKDFYNSVQKVM